LSRYPDKNNDHNQSRHADLFTTDITACEDFLASVGITSESAQWCLRRRRRKHQLRHAHAVEMSREGVPLVVIQRQHADLGITSAYLRGIDNTEIIHAVHERPAPMIPAANGLFILS
jgi:hypothetical protein